MIKTTTGKMYVAEERGYNDAQWFSSYNSFNFGKYQQEHKQAPGDLYVWNDDELEGGRSLSMFIEEPSYVLLLPIIGAVNYKNSNGNNSLVAAGQVQVTAVAKGDVITFSNPFPEHAVNFLQIWIKKPAEQKKSSAYIKTFDTLNDRVNELVSFQAEKKLEELSHLFSIGKFSGRGETVYIPVNPDAALFFFVIEGAFEVEGRLLHRRDGLLLQPIDKAEIEALSNDALLLIAEWPASSC